MGYGWCIDQQNAKYNYWSNQNNEHDYLVYFYGTDKDYYLPMDYDYPWDYSYENDAQWQDFGGNLYAYVICEKDTSIWSTLPNLLKNFFSY